MILYVYSTFENGSSDMLSYLECTYNTILMMLRIRHISSTVGFHPPLTIPMQSDPVPIQRNLKMRMFHLPQLPRISL